MHVLKIIAAIYLSFICGAAQAAGLGTLPFSGAQAGPSFTAAWQPMRLGAGGQLTAVYNYPDNTVLARGDTYGGWVLERTNTCVYGGTSYAAPCWRSLITTTSIPSYSIDTNFAEGVVELVAAPGNTNILYMLWGTLASPTNNLWVSTDRGVTWVLIPSTTGFPGNTETANSGNSMGPFIAVDPNNPDVVFVDTQSHGVYRSTNARSGASSTWTQVSGLTNTVSHVVAFQPGSSTHIGIAEVGTNGFFESTNGTSFSHVTTGSPPPNTLTALHITCDKFNQFWVWDSKAGTSNIWRWASSSWSQINTGLVPSGSGGGATAFAADPNSAAIGSNHLAAVDFTGQMVVSSNNGTTWTAQASNETTAAAADQPTWIGNANQNQVLGSAYDLNGYSVAFDQSSNLLFGGGIGIWQTNAPITGSATVWNANTLGIEELIGVVMVSPPGGYPITGVWDRSIYTSLNPDVFPAHYFNDNPSFPIITNGFGIDYVASKPWFVTFYNPNLTLSAFSTNSGQTWTNWGATPSWTGQSGGNIAASTDQNWVLIPSTNSGIYYTLNQGTTWTASTISGSPTGWIGQGVNQVLAADRVNANQFCAVFSSSAFYQSTNSGQNFAITAATADGSGGAAMLRSVPGKNSVYLFSDGEQSGSAGAHPANTHLWRLTKTTNPCDTATSVNANLKEVMAFGFGAMPPGNASYTTAIYANGWLSGVQGYFVSLDGGTTWASINVPASQKTWALNNADFPRQLEGDPDVYGRLYIVFANSGAGYIDTADACPSVKFTSAIKPNDNLTSTVSLVGQSSGLPASTITSVNFYVDGALIGTQTSGVSAGVPNAPNVKNYTQSWVTGGVAHGAHTLKVEAVGNGCTAGGGSNTQSIPITTS